MKLRAALACFLACALLTLAAGCAPAYHLVVQPAGTSLNAAEADRLAASTDISALAGIDASAGPAMRTTVLTQLRTQGAFGTRAADLLTAGFPERTASVPVLVRGGSFGGIDAIFVVEAWGSTGGKLVHRRLWVFDRTSGQLLRASSFR